ncbi:hypothetical protein QJS04_geneDACA013828 [Acorus gramineus]|uniref:Uncharacterized protein n=1 Tax=Acorus gramineus TaxID=55184 RepID=A0AAV9ATU8_ACOGR|nr:hypothetical protein QJS04_geneDACA013828 [Acorus gramineus]
METSMVMNPSITARITDLTISLSLLSLFPLSVFAAARPLSRLILNSHSLWTEPAASIEHTISHDVDLFIRTEAIFVAVSYTVLILIMFAMVRLSGRRPPFLEQFSRIERSWDASKIVIRLFLSVLIVLFIFVSAASIAIMSTTADVACLVVLIPLFVLILGLTWTTRLLVSLVEGSFRGKAVLRRVSELIRRKRRVSLIRYLCLVSLCAIVGIYVFGYLNRSFPFGRTRMIAIESRVFMSEGYGTDDDRKSSVDWFALGLVVVNVNWILYVFNLAGYAVFCFQCRRNVGWDAMMVSLPLVVQSESVGFTEQDLGV